MPDLYKLKYNNYFVSFGQSLPKLSYTTPETPWPYLLMQFNTNYTPTTDILNSFYRECCFWTQISTEPNIWKLEIHDWAVPQAQIGAGLGVLFCSNADGSSSYLKNVACRLVGCGNLNNSINGVYCQSFDRMFSNALGLQGIDCIIDCTRVTNIGGMFNGCKNVDGGILAQYNWFSTFALNITNHSSTFTDCGSGTGEGQYELSQIPVGWGGTLVPESTLMASSRTNELGTYTTWKITGNAPNWTNIVGLYLFTEASVSTYAGVSMNRSRITKRNSLDTTQGSGALYFYPAFTQYTGSSSSNRVITWVATTDTPNGSLTTSQGNTDMAGTLDYNTYGPITREYGTYNSSLSVYFLFLVTNVPIEDWSGLTDAYGVLYNSNFKTDGGFRYFY